MRDVRESRHRQTKSGGLSRVRQFSLMSVRQGQRMVVRACGRLVLGHGANELLWASHLDPATATDVALDLSCVDDVDARGIGVLADLARRALQRGMAVTVLAASGVVQRLGEMTRLDRALPGTWNERIGLLRCETARRRPTRVDSEARDASCRVGDETSAGLGFGSGQ